LSKTTILPFNLIAASQVLLIFLTSLFSIFITAVNKKCMCASDARGKIKQKIGNDQRKRKKNLEVMGKVRIFAASNITFDYPGRIPRG